MISSVNKCEYLKNDNNIIDFETAHKLEQAFDRIVSFFLSFAEMRFDSIGTHWWKRSKAFENLFEVCEMSSERGKDTFSK